MTLAGDQLIVDLDLSESNLPAWTKLAIGDAVIEITDQPHQGCAKFTQRFGLDAHRFVNSEVGTELHLRGVNARVVTLAPSARRHDSQDLSWLLPVVVVPWRFSLPAWCSALAACSSGR